MQTGCQGCRSTDHEFSIAMAFQPIVDTATGLAYAYEALVRGPDGEGAADVLAAVTEDNRYTFD